MINNAAAAPELAWPAELMTVRQVAETVLLTPKTVRRHIRVGELRAVRLGERAGYRVHRDDAQAWFARHVVRAEFAGGVDQLVLRHRRARLGGAPKAARPPRWST